MKKIALLSALLCASIISFATDWNSIPWLASGNPDYTNKFKVEAAFGQEVVNIQDPWGIGWGIYSAFKAGVEKVEGLSEGQYKIEGAGVLFLVSAFTKKETKLSVEAGGTTFDFKVFYVDGTGDVEPDQEGGEGGEGGSGEGGLTPATFYGQAEADVAGTKVAFEWNITRNANSTLTFEITWNADIEGCVPQICIGETFSTMPSEGKKALFTTKETFKDGDAFTGFFYIAYPGNAARIDILGYTIGASNQKPGGGEEGGEGGSEGGEGGSEGGEGEEGEEGGHGIENVHVSSPAPVKVMVDGQLYIFRDGKAYTPNGQIVLQ